MNGLPQFTDIKPLCTICDQDPCCKCCHKCKQCEEGTCLKSDHLGIVKGKRKIIRKEGVFYE